MRKVRPLADGDLIGLVAPSSPSTGEAVEGAVRAVEKMGFSVRLGRSCHAALGYMAGPEELRAADLNAFFADDAVKAIFCLRGGDGAIRLPPLIDMAVVAAHPKIFLGYSDITILHLIFTQKGGFCTFHGPMVVTDFLRKTFAGYEEDCLLKALCDSRPLGEIVPFEGAPAMEGLVGGCAEGELTGGNLALVCSLLGTPWEIDTRGKVLLLEDTDEPVYRIDRMLSQLRLAGKLEDAAAVVLGQFTNITAKDPKRTFRLEEIFEAVVAPVGKPTVLNAPFGHGTKKATLPLGARAAVDGSRGTVTVIESAVEGA